MLRRSTPPLAFSLLLAAAPASADLFGRFQHGGRATGQAGAFVARADDPAAVSYNPAAIVRREGFELQVGLDFDAPTDDYSSANGSSAAEHTIQFPPALYGVWRPKDARWAVGLGLDSPTWRLMDWETALFPARFTARRSEATLWAFHPVAAWAVTDRFSVGGGLRYVRGTVGYGDTVRGVEAGAGGPVGFEVDRLSEASADGIGFDVATHYAAEGWGFGVVYTSGIEVSGSGDISYLVRDLETLPADVQAALETRYAAQGSEISEDLPDTLTGGAWFALGPAVDLELDAAWTRWSGISPEASQPGTPFALERRAGWDDTLSLRLGVEWEVGGGLRLGGGLGLEPSPAADPAVEPGAPRGDAFVYSLGASYDVTPVLSFDLGYSFHDYDTNRARGQEPDPNVASSYTARAQVFAVSARWRFAAEN